MWRPGREANDRQHGLAAWGHQSERPPGSSGFLLGADDEPVDLAPPVRTPSIQPKHRASSTAWGQLSVALPVPLPGIVAQRRFLENGDTVILCGWCAKPGTARIGFVESRGEVLPANG